MFWKSLFVSLVISVWFAMPPRCATAQVTIGEWGSHEPISFLFGSTPSHATTALQKDDSGDLHVLFRFQLGGLSQDIEIWHVRRDAATGVWTTSPEISTLDVRNLTPAMWVSPDGTVDIIWGLDDGSVLSMMHRRRDPVTGNWSDPETFFTFPQLHVGIGPYPSLAMVEGSLHVVFVQRNDEGGSTIWHARRDETWQYVQVVRHSEESSPFPALTCNDLGQLVLAWANREIGERGLYLEWFDPASQSWNQEITPVTDGSRWPRVLMAPSGALHIAWNEFYSLFYMKRSTDGIYSEPVALDAGGWSLPSTLTMGPAGDVHVLWGNFTNDPGYYASRRLYWATRYRDGTWRPPSLVLPEHTAPQERGHLIIDGDSAYLAYQWVDGIDLPSEFRVIFTSATYAASGTQELPLPSAQLAQNFPNPFNPLTRIRFSIPQAGNVDVTVIDVQGRVQKSLIQEWMEPGEYLVDFDGVDNRGQELASGIYFYRVQGPWGSSSRKMTLLR